MTGMEPAGATRTTSESLSSGTGPGAGAKPPAAHLGGSAEGGSERRFWSPRRVPSVILALIGLIIAIGALYDTISVRAGEPAQQWRRKIADELATRHMDDGWVIGAGFLALVLGLWLIWLAVTPGLRAVLPMRTFSPDVRAGLDRRAAALILRDSALQVAGVSSARVKVKRRKAKARAEVNFRDVEEVRRELRVVLLGSIEQLGVARSPRLALTVREVSGK
jgi:Family of unknown function (DUF6286)